MNEFWDRADKLPAEQRAAFVMWARQQLTRQRIAHEYPSAGALAQALDPETIQTPDLAMIDRELEWAFTTPGARLMISKPSQTGKSKRVAIWGIIRALILNPDRRVIIATHSEDLARTHSEEIRTIIRTFGTGARDALTGIPLPDQLGIGLGDKAAAGRWTLAGHKGGVVAVGTGTALPGKPADLLLLDDLYSGMDAADSPAERRRVNTWWDTVASQRPGPDAPVIMIGTRWNEADAHAYLMEREPGRWRVLNFPAIAETGLHDSLGRAPGVPLENPRGKTNWEAIREAKPARVWSSMFQGSPTPSGGTLFNSAWFERHRLEQAPGLYRRIVAVDPAETGKGDEAGIIGAGLAGDGTVVLTDDASGHMSSAVWPRAACLLALQTDASELVFEGYNSATTYDGLLVRAYKDLVVEAAGSGGAVEGRQVPLVRPFVITSWKGTGNALVRSTGLRHATSSGACRVVGHRCATMETHAVRWMEGQHCPDRIAAATIAFDVLAGGGEAVVGGGAGDWGNLPDGFTGR